MHWATAIDRPAVPVDPHDVNVAAADGDLLFENFRALVDHWIKATLEHFLVGNFALLDAFTNGEVLDELLDFLVGRGRTGLGVVRVVAHAVLLATATVLAQHFADRRRGRLLLLPTNIKASEIAHRERPHGEAKVEQHLVDLGGRGSFEQHALSFGTAHEQHAVADEARAHTDHGRNLANLFTDRHRGRDDAVGRLVTAYVLEQLHDVGRAEEVHTNDTLGAAGDFSDLVDIERRRV